MKKETTSVRLLQLMKERNLRQVDILQKCKPFCEKLSIKLGRNDLSQYVNGKVEPGQEKLTVLGLALNVNEAWLMGYDVPMERSGHNSLEYSPKIIQYYKILNDIGKKEATKRVEELTHLPQYIQESNPYEVQAAHARTDIEITEEMVQHDMDIMDDENF